MPGASPRVKIALLARLLVCLLACPIVVWAGAAAGQGVDPRTAQLHRIDTPPQIDGRLDEPFWSELPPMGALVQSEPVEGAEPTERTEMWIAFDDENLYLGIRMYDSEPSKLIAKQMVLDADMTSDDRINLVFDTFHDSRNAYFFQINPIGTRSDALIENNSVFRRDWNGIWYAQARVDAEGWTAEFAIPFKTVPMAWGGTRWGFEAERIVRRKNEKLRWANPSQNRSITDVAGIGVIEGLHDVDATGIDLKPSAALGQELTSPAALPPGSEPQSDPIVKPAGDVFWKVHPSVVIAATGNTNFIESPPDDLRTELTRFPPNFPEKRDFFLQDAGIFDFGGIVGNGTPFFSRRIGRLNGDALDINGGGKLTGRLGRLTFGGLGVTLPAQEGIERTNLVVGRAQYGVLAESAIGMIGTWGDPTGETDNGVVGADFQYFNSDVGGGQIVSSNAWFMKSFSDVGGSDDLAGGVNIEYPNDKYNGKLAYTQIGLDFDPRLGFANRRGIHQYDASARRRWRPGTWLRTVDTQLTGFVVTDRDHDLETVQLTWNALELRNQLGDGVRFTYVYNDERLLREPFEIDPGIQIPQGEYRFHRYGVKVDTANARVVSASAEVIWGSFFSGDMLQLIGSLSLRPVKYAFLQVEYEQDDANLAEGDFVKRLTRVRANFAFTPEISWTNTVQYERSGRLLQFSSNFRWQLTPGNDLWVVVTQDWGEATRGEFEPTVGSQAIKLAWTIRY